MVCSKAASLYTAPSIAATDTAARVDKGMGVKIQSIPGTSFADMHLHCYNILPALQPYIKLICTMESDADTDTRCIRVLPDTCVELFINYTPSPVAIIGNTMHQRSIVTFRMSRPMDVHMRKGAGCLAICFYPGMAYRFFGVPMNELSDTTTALTDLWGSIAAALEDKLANTRNNEARAELVQQYLLQRSGTEKQDRQVAYCLAQAQDSGGSIPVGRLSQDTGLSQRHLSRKFQYIVGLSPKEYLRACRFVQSLHHLKRYPALSLTEIAYESGYYDQAHFIRDYKVYTGHTPSEVVHANHIVY